MATIRKQKGFSLQSGLTFVAYEVKRTNFKLVINRLIEIKMKVAKLLVIISIITLFGCKSEIDYRNIYSSKKEVFNQLSKLNLKKYNFLEITQSHIMFDGNVDKKKLSADSVLISDALKKVGSNCFIYRKNHYLSVRYENDLKGFFLIQKKIDGKIDFDNYVGSLSELLKRNEGKVTPFAEMLDKNWYWIEINENI